MGHAGACAMRKNETRAGLRWIVQQRRDRRLRRDLDLERLGGGGFQIGNPKVCCRLILHFSRVARKRTCKRLGKQIGGFENESIALGNMAQRAKGGFTDSRLMLL